jgi:hypothetical protein
MYNNFLKKLPDDIINIIFDLLGKVEGIRFIPRDVQKIFCDRCYQQIVEHFIVRCIPGPFGDITKMPEYFKQDWLTIPECLKKNNVFLDDILYNHNFDGINIVVTMFSLFRVFPVCTWLNHFKQVAHNKNIIMTQIEEHECVNLINYISSYVAPKHSTTFAHLKKIEDEYFEEIKKSRTFTKKLNWLINLNIKIKCYPNQEGINEVEELLSARKINSHALIKMVSECEIPQPQLIILIDKIKHNGYSEIFVDYILSEKSKRDICNDKTTMHYLRCHELWTREDMMLQNYHIACECKKKIILNDMWMF